MLVGNSTSLYDNRVDRVLQSWEDGVKKKYEVKRNWTVFRLRGAKTLFKELSSTYLIARDGMAVCDNLINVVKGEGGNCAEHEGY